MTNPESENIDIKEKLVVDLATSMHEAYCEGRNYKPREKVEVIDKEGNVTWKNLENLTDEDTINFTVDIANTPYEKLPEYWQRENKIAAESAIEVCLDALKTNHLTTLDLELLSKLDLLNLSESEQTLKDILEDTSLLTDDKKLANVFWYDEIADNIEKLFDNKTLVIDMAVIIALIRLFEDTSRKIHDQFIERRKKEGMYVDSNQDVDYDYLPEREYNQKSGIYEVVPWGKVADRNIARKAFATLLSNYENLYT